MEWTMSSADHRNTNRVRSFLRGEIVHSNGSSKTECTVRDISDGGARIEAPVSVTVPEHFVLAIPQRNLRHRARMIWRHGTELGVVFQLTTAQPAPQAPGAADNNAELRLRMLELEAETARLRAQLAEMRAALDGVMRERKSA
jgi:hypothetical protein